MKIAACVEYDGTAYCGWQRLSHAPSVQETVEKALSTIANQSIEVVCAGRTDSGVHAVGQVIHFETNVIRTMRSWLRGTNSNLPDDIALRWVKQVDDDFHARFSAYERQYRYIILNRKARPALQNKHVTWVFDPLDVKIMHQAAQLLLGEKDFSSFRASGCQARHAMREILSVHVVRDDELIYIDIVANAFLHHMVRNIVGTLIEVGRGKRSVEQFANLIVLKDRNQADMTAAAKGLYFVSVSYPEVFAIPKNKRLPIY
jgi:tRNA pseudouridine38-40 synthase